MKKKIDTSKNWTWESVHHYHRCTKCGYVEESRDDFENRWDSLTKDLKCSRCGYYYSVFKKQKPTFGPLM